MTEPSVQLDDVKAVLVDTLALERRADSIGPDTPLLGGVPELDSRAVLELIVDLEKRFGIRVADEEVRAEVFESLASLTDFVRSKT